MPHEGANVVPTLRKVLGLGSQQKTNLELPSTFIKHRVIEVLRELFSHRTDGYKWSQDEKVSGIQIADVYALNFESVENKPSIVVRRGTMTWEHRFINQFLESWGQAAAPIKSDLRMCNVILNCTGRGGLEAEFIADIVDNGFFYFRDAIRKAADGILDVRPEGMGQEMLVRSDSDAELSVVPVSLNAFFQPKGLVIPTGAKPLAGVRVNAVDP